MLSLGIVLVLFERRQYHVFIYRLFPHLNLSVELAHTSNMRFMKFDSGIVETLLEDDDKDEEAWKRKSVKVSTLVSYDLLDFNGDQI